MVRKLLLLVIVIFLGLALVQGLSDTKFTINLKPGWNLVPENTLNTFLVDEVESQRFLYLSDHKQLEGMLVNY